MLSLQNQVEYNSRMRAFIQMLESAKRPASWEIDNVSSSI